MSCFIWLLKTGLTILKAGEISFNFLSMFGVGLDSEKRIFNEKMRKEHKKREKMGKETIRIRKSANDIIVINYSVHSNNQNEYMPAH